MNTWRNYGSVIAALELIRETKTLIERYSRIKPEELDIAISAIQEGGPFARREAFRDVIGLCHPKAYGDLFMGDFPSGGKGWMQHLSKLEKACGQAFKKLENENHGA